MEAPLILKLGSLPKDCIPQKRHLLMKVTWFKLKTFHEISLKVFLLLLGMHFFITSQTEGIYYSLPLSF